MLIKILCLIILYRKKRERNEYKKPDGSCFLLGAGDFILEAK